MAIQVFVLREELFKREVSPTNDSAYTGQQNPEESVSNGIQPLIPVFWRPKTIRTTTSHDFVQDFKRELAKFHFVLFTNNVHEI